MDSAYDRTLNAAHKLKKADARKKAIAATKAALGPAQKQYDDTIKSWLNTGSMAAVGRRNTGTLKGYEAALRDRTVLSDPALRRKLSLIDQARRAARTSLKAVNTQAVSAYRKHVKLVWHRELRVVGYRGVTAVPRAITGALTTSRYEKALKAIDRYYESDRRAAIAQHYRQVKGQN